MPMHSKRDVRACISAYVRHCFAAETPPRVSEFATFLGVSPRTLRRWMATELNATPSAVIRELRLEYAQRLRNTGLSTTRVAYRAGFGTRRTYFRQRRLARVRGVTAATALPALQQESSRRT